MAETVITVDIPGGYEAELSMLTARDYLSVRRLKDDGPDSAYVILDILDRACLSTTRPSGDLLDMTIEDAGDVWRAYMRGGREAALPPETGDGSPSPSPRPRSRRRTAGPRPG